ncbi:MAG: molybdate ABC transporter substrate-binding protein [Proteobacteria bacterium]|nr:molybdate ABC transporter substrate-binding protein [Pseudomonadota bacterium]
MRILNFILISFILMTWGTTLFADNIKVAIASNFIKVAKEVAKIFEQDQGHRITLIFGSTGKHYAQIRNGAPYDLFFAADLKRPKLLEDEGLAIMNSRFTYALGQIVLWSPESNMSIGQQTLVGDSKYRLIAVANPKLAPYGRAAQQVMEGLKVWNSWRKRMVRGENIGQTFQFVRSGNVNLGFVAYSQLKTPDGKINGSYWLVPRTLYSLIEQQAVALNDNRTANLFLDFFKTEVIRALIQKHGYNTPPGY